MMVWLIDRVLRLVGRLLLARLALLRTLIDDIFLSTTRLLIINLLRSLSLVLLRARSKTSVDLGAHVCISLVFAWSIPMRHGLTGASAPPWRSIISLLFHLYFFLHAQRVTVFNLLATV